MIARHRHRADLSEAGAEVPASPADIRSVARIADVSVGTVSNVVNHPDRVAHDTIERVNLVIEQLHWTPNPAARSLAHSRRTEP